MVDSLTRCKLIYGQETSWEDNFICVSRVICLRNSSSWNNVEELLDKKQT